MRTIACESLAIPDEANEGSVPLRSTLTAFVIARDVMTGEIMK